MNRRPFVALATAYLAGAFMLLPRVWSQINPVGITYLAIAERYLAGEMDPLSRRKLYASTWSSSENLGRTPLPPHALNSLGNNRPPAAN